MLHCWRLKLDFSSNIFFHIEDSDDDDDIFVWNQFITNLPHSDFLQEGQRRLLRNEMTLSACTFGTMKKKRYCCFSLMSILKNIAGIHVLLASE